MNAGRNVLTGSPSLLPNANSARSVLAFCALYTSGWSSATIAESSGYTPPVGYTATLDVNT